MFKFFKNLFRKLTAIPFIGVPLAVASIAFFSISYAVAESANLAMAHIRRKKFLTKRLDEPTLAKIVKFCSGMVYASAAIPFSEYAYQARRAHQSLAEGFDYRGKPVSPANPDMARVHENPSGPGDVVISDKLKVPRADFSFSSKKNSSFSPSASPKPKGKSKVAGREFEGESLV